MRKKLLDPVFDVQAATVEPAVPIDSKNHQMELVKCGVPGGPHVLAYVSAADRVVLPAFGNAATHRQTIPHSRLAKGKPDGKIAPIT